MLYNLLIFAGFMKSLGGILLAVLILLAMVTVHEFGHYIVGKWLGFKINEFSVGFGPALFKKQSKKTGEFFSLRWIPLGGYCAFDGEDEGFEEETPELKGNRFNDQAPWKRILVLIAGATMNYLLALLIIITAFACIGRPAYVVEKGVPTVENSMEAINSYAKGLKTGDVILSVDGKTVYLATDICDALNGKKKGEIVEVEVIREGEERIVPVTLTEDANVKNMSDYSALFFSLGIAHREEVVNEAGETVLGVTRGGGLTTTSLREGFAEILGNSFVYSFKIGSSVLRSLGELLMGKMGIDMMGGPITTISMTAEAASTGMQSFLNIAAFIGVNLAVFNLLPIPALDGSKVIFCIIEWLRGKPINRKVEAIIHFAGIIFLFGFAILVDILQLF